MIALFNPYHHRGEGIKWGLVTYTTVMFSFVTVCCGMKFEILLISFVDNREFPGVAGVFPPGPIGYQWLIYSKPLTIVPNLMFFLNNWLADGLLVGSPFYTTSGCLTSTPLALSLLRDLCHELLGHRLPLPHVPWLLVYVFEFFTVDSNTQSWHH